VTPRYEIPCSVQGEILVGDETITVDAWGQRDHSWGAARDWWANQWCWNAGRLEDGTRFHSVAGLFPGHDWGVAYEMAGKGSEMEDFDEVRLGIVEGRERLPESTRLGFGSLDLHVTPLAFSPVGLVHPEDGRLARFPRALARFTAADGRIGGGWIEWNQPPRPA
jgi:hypothetical protein